MRKAWMRMRRANSAREGTDGDLLSGGIEIGDRFRNPVHVLIAEGHVHGQHEETAKQGVGARQLLSEPQGAALMHRVSTPLNEHPDSASFKMGAQPITVFGLDFVILENIEVVRVAI